VIPRGHCSNPTSRSSACALRDGLSMTRAATRCWSPCRVLPRGPAQPDETIARLKAYSSAGADCLYAPGLRTREQFAAVVEALAPKPVNALVGWPADLTVADSQASACGASVSGRAGARGVGGFTQAAKLLAERGSFAGFEGAVPGAELNAVFATREK